MLVYLLGNGSRAEFDIRSAQCCFSSVGLALFWETAPYLNHFASLKVSLLDLVMMCMSVFFISPRESLGRNWEPSDSSAQGSAEQQACGGRSARASFAPGGLADSPERCSHRLYACCCLLLGGQDTCFG